MPVTLTHTDSGVVTLLLDRPQKRNALNVDMLEQLLRHVETLQNAAGIRAIIVRGADSSFSAGADINDWADPGPALANRRSQLGSRAFQALSELPVPSIALVEGVAAGGGLELALACDLQIAVAGARVGFPEARLGNLPAWGGIPRLIENVGVSLARRLLLTGDLIDATYAAEIGLLTMTCDAEAVEATLRNLIASLQACDPGTQALIKTVLSNWALRHPMEPTLAAYAALLDTSRERKQAFLHRPRAAVAPPASERSGGTTGQDSSAPSSSRRPTT